MREITNSHKPNTKLDKNWHIQRNESKSVKYLGMTLDAKLHWKAHVKKKREKMDFRYKRMYWLIGRNSALSLHNKLLLYKQILKPICTYGIQLWGLHQTK